MPGKEILGKAKDKAEQIDALLEAFEELIDKNASLLTQAIIKSFVDQLDSKNGVILSTAQNLKKVELIDQAYFKFQDQQGMAILSHLMTDMDKIMLLNADYFKELNGGRPIKDEDIKRVLRERLGITSDGELIRDGYMMGLLDDPQVRNEIKQYAYQRMIGGAGFQDFRKGLKALVEGDPDRMGIFKRFYRNYAFDSYAQADATNGALYAQKLGLRYFIYNGGIMRDKKGRVKSRPFCVKRAGKVFSTEEADKWKSDKDLTAVDSRATYVWQTQRGGFGCRHSIDWISEELAQELRPDLVQPS